MKFIKVENFQILRKEDGKDIEWEYVDAYIPVHFVVLYRGPDDCEAFDFATGSFIPETREVSKPKCVFAVYRSMAKHIGFHKRYKELINKIKNDFFTKKFFRNDKDMIVKRSGHNFNTRKISRRTRLIFDADTSVELKSDRMPQSKLKVSLK